MRTTCTVTIPVAGTVAYAVLGPFQHGSLLQGANLFGQDTPADLTFRLGLFDRPPASSVEFTAGDQLSYASVIPQGVGFWTLGLTLGQRMLSKRYLAVEFSFSVGLAAAWVGGLNGGVLSPILQRLLVGGTSAAGRLSGFTHDSGGPPLT